MTSIGKKCCSILLFISLSLYPAIGWSEAMYQVSSGELLRLERNLTELRDINDRQSRESVTLKNQLKAQLTEAKKQSLALQGQLAGLKVTISEQGSSLQNANRLLKQYEEEEKYRQRKIKQQRNIAYVIAATAIFVAVRNASR